MEQEHFRRLEALFQECLGVGRDERAAILERAAAIDPRLREELVRMLAEHEDPTGLLSDTFLDRSEGFKARLAGVSLGTASSAVEEFRIPEKIGRYRIVGEIARGGVGIVLRGRDDVIGRDVAIKILLDAEADPGLTRRFREEGQIGGQLQHPGIVPIYELGRLEGEQSYIAMKFVKGRTLADLLASRRDPHEDRAQLLNIFEQLCQVVGYAHARRVVHRDLKPANLMVGDFGEVQVMDWGLAKSLDSGSTPNGPAEPVTTVHRRRNPALSAAGSIMGTPAYMPPEQARGGVETLDERADVFSLGAILCEILTGRGPYAGRSTEELIRAARRAELAGAGERIRTSGADGQLVELALDCLAAEPDERPANAGIVAGRIRAYLQSLEERARQAALEAAAARVRAEGERRSRRLTMALGGVVVVSLLVAGSVWFQLEIGRAQRKFAQEQRLVRALAEAQQLRDEAETQGVRATEKWDAALAAARAAHDLVTGDVAPELSREADELLAQVGKRHSAGGFIAELDTVRVKNEYLHTLEFGRRQFRAYRTLFARHFGTDFLGMPTEEAAERIKQMEDDAEFGVVLDLWARAARHSEGPRAESFRKLLDIANLVDDDPWRRELRRAGWEGDKEALLRLAEAPSFAEQSAHSAYLLAIYLLWVDADQELVNGVLERAQFDFPGDFTINYDLATFMEGDDALRYATAAVTIRPENAFGHAVLGRELVHAGRSDLAEPHLERALRLLPDDGVVAQILAEAYMDGGRYDRAIEEARRAIALKGDGPEGAQLSDYWRLGVLQVERRSYEEAVTTFRKGIEAGRATRSLFPYYLVNTLNGIGLCLHQTGRFEEAIAAYRRAEAVEATALARKNIGWSLQALGRHEEAIEVLQSAFSLKPGNETKVLLLGHLGRSQEALGHVVDAFESYRRLLELDPNSDLAYERLGEILNQNGEEVPRQAAVALVAELDRRLHSGEPAHAAAAGLYVDAWCRAPDALFNYRVLAMVNRLVEESGRSDAPQLDRLGRVLFLLDRPGEAVLVLEEGVRLPGDHAAMGRRLEDYRTRIYPELVSYASIDAAVAGEDANDVGEAYVFPQTSTGPAAELRALYLSARRMLRDGKAGEARVELEQLLARDREWPEPFLALWEALSREDPEAAEQEFRRVVAEGPLPRRTLPVSAAAPDTRGAEPSGYGMKLIAGGFHHLDPRVRHEATHWQIRRADEDYDHRPVLDAWSRASLSERSVPILLPGAYWWRVRYLGTDGRETEFAEEAPFEIADTGLEPVSFDLSGHFDRDVVADKGDADNDAFDQGGHCLAVEGPSVRGLPADGRVGCHRLGSFRERNAILLTPHDASPVEIAAPPGRYVALRLLVSAANGDAELPIACRFEGGAVVRHTVRCPDWFSDPEPSSADAGWTPVLNGMDRVRAGMVTDRGDAALFDVEVPVSVELELTALELGGEGGRFEGDESRAWVFSVVGLREE